MNNESAGKHRNSVDSLPESPRADHPVALEMSNVSVQFRRRDNTPLTIVSDLNLAVPTGTIHAVIGRSGSGKTTLLQVAVGALKPQSGTVSWNGIVIDGLSPKKLASARRAHMGYVDQGATAVNELTVIDNVLIPAVPIRATSEFRTRAHDLLFMFGLQERERHRARSLSGGERQRLALARALLLGPTAVAIDEPTASLDRDSAITVIDALGQLSAAGTAIIVASHDDAVLEIAETVTQLNPTSA